MKQYTIKQNAFDNWYGYLGGKRMTEFAETLTQTQEQAALEWLEKMSTPTTFTPGPWIHTTDYIGVHQESTGTCIADLGSEGAPDIGAEESEANARLIAAAPDLLAALKKALNVMNEVGHPRHGYECGDERQAAFEAIQKATGGL